MIINSKESEMMVLGCMLTNIENLKIGVQSLLSDDFYYKEHKIIFNVLKETYLANISADILIICEKLKTINKLENIGGVEYLVFLVQYVGTAAYFEAYLDQLIEYSSKRKIYELIVNSCSKNLSEIKNKIDEVFNNAISKQQSIDTLYRSLLMPTSEQEIIDEIKKTSSGMLVGFSIGEIDVEFFGGTINVIAGPTSHGKTTLLINFALGALKKNPNKSIYFFTYEESKSSIMTLFLNVFMQKTISKNNRCSIENYFREESIQHIKEERKEEFIKDKQIFFETLICSGRLNIVYSEMCIEQLCQAIKYLNKHRKDIGAIFIDYIQLLNLFNYGKLNRQEQLKNICLILKDCAIDTGLPIIIGAQFNRQVTCEADLSPIYISEAGDIERIASLIIGFWNRNFLGFSREGNKTKKGEIIDKPKSEIYIEILKGRKLGNGHNSVLHFDGNMGIIKNISNELLDEIMVF